VLAIALSESCACSRYPHDHQQPTCHSDREDTNKRPKQARLNEHSGHGNHYEQEQGVGIGGDEAVGQMSEATPQ
jgi:hypothetical protein